MFSSKYPNVVFLDQPLNATFSELTEWACETIRSQAELSNKKIKLLGHSFGGQLIAAAIPSIKDFVCEIRLLNSAYGAFDCFVNLQNTLNPQSSQSLQSWEMKTPEEKMNMIFSISQHPQFAESYWLNPAARSTYEAINANYPPLDIGSFVKAFSGYLQLPPQSQKNTWPGKVEIYYSLEDNLIKNFEVVARWKELFPTATFIKVSSVGHYGLFESPQLASDFFKD
jgi:hypothetical protein